MEHTERGISIQGKLLDLIKDGANAQQALYRTSKEAEAKIAVLESDLTDTIKSLCNKTRVDLRNTTDQRITEIGNVIEDLTEKLRLMSNSPNENVITEDSLKLIKDIEETELFKGDRSCFEENRNLLHSLKCFKSAGTIYFVSKHDLKETKSEICVSDEQSFKVAGTRRLIEQGSWNSLSFGSPSLSSLSTLTSISDNEFYDSVSLKKPGSQKTSLTDKTKIINSGNCGHDIVRYAGQFESRPHRNPCVIPDITVMPDMKIVLVDHYHNSIQLFNESFDFLDEKTCAYPMSVTATGPKTVVATLRRNSELAVFDIVSNSLRLRKTMAVKCSKYLWQVSFKADKLWVVCDENDIHVMDLNGTEFFVLHSGVPAECGYVRYSDVSDDGSRIFLSEKKGLRCIDTKGNLQWEFKQEDFPESERDNQGHVIEGVCYFNGSVLGAHWTHSKLYQISSDGKFMRNIVVEHLEHPRVMSIMGSRLVVTQFHPMIPAKNRRTIQVFEISDLWEVLT